MPKQLLDDMRKYYLLHKPAHYFFEGFKKGIPMHSRSFQHCVQRYVNMIGLSGKGYSCHTLRHSFATHLLENGTDICTIKDLLGHTNIITTMLYLQLRQSNLARVESPFDELMCSES
ncbi:MAG: tyrosine-type recombinase/integrase [Chitinophagaceae bacterium]|nr:tyrosine-type recombinase/integrase [Chitinophagaceae bacterium]